jgi:hypothetical protein
MIYTIEKATLLTNQLRKFTTSYTHLLVGQFANIEFWLDEIQGALKTIDEYKNRYTNRRDAQKEWVDNHGTKVPDYCAECGGKCEFDDGPSPPSPPVRTSHTDLDAAYSNLSDAAYEFLLRCFRAGFLDQPSLENMCKRAGTSLDPSDLRRKK